MSTASEKANLARIRDNQRRSRARRKEYLQELEARLRQCELQGIEASSEIQMAARRVADENKKLRILLAQHGVSDEVVETHLQTSHLGSMVMGVNSPSVQILEQLLQTRKACCDGNAGANTLGMRRTTQSRDSSFGGTTVHSLWEPVHTSRSVSAGQLSSGKTTPMAHQFIASSGEKSRHHSVSLIHDANACIHDIQQHQHSQGYNITPISIPRPHSPSSTISTMHTPSIYDFDSQLLSSPSYNANQMASMHQHLQPAINSHPSDPRPLGVYVPPTASNPSTNTNNMNSCVLAADMISTMAGGDHQVVSAELGCLPGVDCAVDNQLVFNIMDKYTGTNVGL